MEIHFCEVFIQETATYPIPAQSSTHFYNILFSKPHRVGPAHTSPRMHGIFYDMENIQRKFRAP